MTGVSSFTSCNFDSVRTSFNPSTPLDTSFVISTSGVAAFAGASVAGLSSFTSSSCKFDGSAVPQNEDPTVSSGSMSDMEPITSTSGLDTCTSSVASLISSGRSSVGSDSLTTSGKIVSLDSGPKHFTGSSRISSCSLAESSSTGAAGLTGSGIMMSDLMIGSGSAAVIIASSPDLTFSSWIDPNMSLFSSLALLKLPRRFLFISSTLITALSLSLLGTFIFLKTKLQYLSWTDSLGWVPLALILLIYSGSQLGFNPITKLIISEVFPTEVRI